MLGSMGAWWGYGGGKVLDWYRRAGWSAVLRSDKVPVSAECEPQSYPFDHLAALILGTSEQNQVTVTLTLRKAERREAGIGSNR